MLLNTHTYTHIGTHNYTVTHTKTKDTLTCTKKTTSVENLTVNAFLSSVIGPVTLCPSLDHLSSVELPDHLLQTHLTAVNSSIHVSCKRGYWLPMEKSILTCDVNGHWQPKPGECEPIQCLRLNELENLHLSLEEIEEKNSSTNIMKYRCKDGYKVANNQNENKKEVRKWKFCIEVQETGKDGASVNETKLLDNMPACLPVNCSYPQKVSNAEISFTGLTFGSTIIYYCQSGFHTENSTSGECLGSGVWSISPPVCQGKENSMMGTVVITQNAH